MAAEEEITKLNQAFEGLLGRLAAAQANLTDGPVRDNLSNLAGQIKSKLAEFGTSLREKEKELAEAKKQSAASIAKAKAAAEEAKAKKAAKKAAAAQPPPPAPPPEPIDRHLAGTLRELLLREYGDQSAR
jgi:membrane protein involved in colicin uptake